MSFQCRKRHLFSLFIHLIFSISHSLPPLPPLPPPLCFLPSLRLTEIYPSLPLLLSPSLFLSSLSLSFYLRPSFSFHMIISPFSFLFLFPSLSSLSLSLISFSYLHPSSPSSFPVPFLYVSSLFSLSSLSLPLLILLSPPLSCFCSPSLLSFSSIFPPFSSILWFKKWCFIFSPFLLLLISLLSHLSFVFSLLFLQLLPHPLFRRSSDLLLNCHCT